MWLGILLALFFLVIAIFLYRNRKDFNGADNITYSADACIFAYILIVVIIIVKLVTC